MTSKLTYLLTKGFSLLGVLGALVLGGCNTTGGPLSERPRLYNIAHMTNTVAAVDWAVSAGANAVEADLKFDEGGKTTYFHHGKPCDCTIINRIGKYGVCRIQPSCEAKDTALDLLHAIARHKKSIALFIIDSKLDESWTRSRQQAAGNHIVRLLDKELFGRGYPGRVIVGAPKGTDAPFIWAAAETSQGSPNRNRILFTLDGEGKKDSVVIRQLQRIKPDQRSYGVGYPSHLPIRYYDQIERAVAARASGELSFVYIWGLDRKRSMRAYLKRGVDGIMTNAPGRLNEVLGESSDRAEPPLAGPEDLFPNAAPTSYRK